EYNLWGWHQSGTASKTLPPSGTYWASGTESQEAIWLLRGGGPLLLIAMALVVVAGIAVFLRMRGLANNCGWAAASVGASGVILFVLGVNQNWDAVKNQAVVAGTGGTTLAADWSIGMYLGIAAIVLVVVGTYFAAMKPKSQAQPGRLPQRPSA
ncbi:MAG: hypothetical protein LC620_04920, partial [Halobacteriales archaeon]|nr:hypothetical protein [Halobacteriales archaeon]